MLIWKQVKMNNLMDIYKADFFHLLKYIFGFLWFFTHDIPELCYRDRKDIEMNKIE
jgi:hypothetical protein